MSVRLEGDMILLEGDCRIEDAEPLIQLILQAPLREVDVSGLRHMHGALLQILLSFRSPICGAPDDPFLRDHVIPHLFQTSAIAGRR